MSDSPDQPESKFERKLREYQEAEEAKQRAANPPSEAFDADLVPADERNLSEADKALDEAISHIDIIDAYVKYCGKMIPVVKNGQREGIKISCPIPGHADVDPSAWINLDKQTWFCGGCNVGGDSHDLAAYGKGYSVPGYKTDGTFHALREEMGANFGFFVLKGPGGTAIIAETEAEEPTVPVTDIKDSADSDDSSVSSVKTDSTDSDSTADVIEMFEEEDRVYLVPALDWQSILTPNTFLDEYMKATRVDDVPEEYHFFHALMALGLAMGRDVTLYDSVPVYGNLFICTLGRSGSGKSKAKYHLDRLLEQALPYRHEDENSKGTKRVAAPGSAEVLIYNFQKPIMDPSDPKRIAYYAPVRGLIEFNELSALVSRTNRMGSAIKPTMMQFFDMESTVATSSMTHGIKEASEPFACAVTSTQPKALKTLLDGADDTSGFLNRWTFVLGTVKKRFAIGGTVVDVSPAVPFLEEVLGWAGGFRTAEQITWSEEAAERFTDFFHSTIERDKNMSQTDLIIRIDLLVKKLILLFTANEKLKEVPISSVEKAIACYDFLIASFAVPAGEIGSTKVGECQQAIMDIALAQYKRNGKGITLREINKSLWRRKYPIKMINDIADHLVKAGMLKLTVPPATQKGPKTVRYCYVD